MRKFIDFTYDDPAAGTAIYTIGYHVCWKLNRSGEKKVIREYWRFDEQYSSFQEAFKAHPDAIITDELVMFEEQRSFIAQVGLEAYLDSVCAEALDRVLGN